MLLLEKIGMDFAARAMLVLLSCVMVFHLLVLSGLIPYGIVWGGNLKSPEQMQIFEAVSLLVNGLVIAVIAMRGGYIRPWLPHGLVSALLWVLAALFLVNTLGNLLAQSWLEMLLFTPLTLASAILCARMALGLRDGTNMPIENTSGDGS